MDKVRVGESPSTYKIWGAAGNSLEDTVLGSGGKPEPIPLRSLKPLTGTDYIESIYSGLLDFLMKGEMK